MSPDIGHLLGQITAIVFVLTFVLVIVFGLLGVLVNIGILIFIGLILIPVKVIKRIFWVISHIFIALHKALYLGKRFRKKNNAT